VEPSSNQFLFLFLFYFSFLWQTFVGWWIFFPLKMQKNEFFLGGRSYTSKNLNSIKFEIVRF
jgi:hypothetical protein